MKRKYKIIIIVLVVALVAFGAGITYSLFRSDNIITGDQGIAKFIFNAERLDELELPISNLNPGDESVYPFSISNSSSESTSNVTVEYQMTLKTYHFVPLIIELYKIVDEQEQRILTCDETYTRSSTNELLCNTPIEEMTYSSNVLDNYKLKIKFSSEYNSSEYAGLVDYLNIEIRSWQKIDE